MSIPAPAGAGTPGLVALKLVPNALHHGGLGIARSAGRLGIPVYGVHEGRWAPAARSRYDRGGLRHPGAASPERWIEQLQDLGRRVGPAVLVPIDDAAGVFVADHRHVLREHFRFADQSPETIRRLSDKGEMHRLCSELDVPTPACRFPASSDDVEAYAEAGPFPVVVKRMAAWLPAAAPDARSVAIARRPDELRVAYAAMECAERPNVLLQEYIPGGPESVWMFNGYFDAESVCRVGFTGRKLRSGGPHTGPTTLGVCIPNPEVARATQRLMAAVGYRGALDIGFRHDARDGRYKLLDVNPRLGGTFRLFVGTNGLDVLRALYLDLTGQPIPRSEASNGRTWIDEPNDLVVSARMARRGELSLRRWLRSLRGIDEAAWFAADDLLPFFLGTGQGLAHRVLRRASATSRGPAPGHLSAADAAGPGRPVSVG
jgi:D-aspartate ligase